MPTSKPALRSTLADDPEMKEIVRLFADELPKRLEAIQTAIRTGSTRDVVRLAHHLKGASAGYGYPSIGEAAARLESALTGAGGLAPKALEDVKAHVDSLVELCERARGSSV